MFFWAEKRTSVRIFSFLLLKIKIRNLVLAEAFAFTGFLFCEVKFYVESVKINIAHWKASF